MNGTLPARCSAGFAVLLLQVMMWSQAGADIKRVPSEFAMIQRAINASSPGDTVLVAEGRYYENIRLMGKAIVVCSEYAIDGDTGHVSRTIIDGSRPAHPDSGSVVMFVDGEDTTSVLCGFTVTGGTGHRFVDGGISICAGGGVFVGRGGGARICGNIIEKNRCVDMVELASGGGISAGPPGSNAFVIVENNTIRCNAVRGLGVGRGGGADILLNCRAMGNRIIADTAMSGNTVFGGGFVVARSPASPQPEVLVCNNVVCRNVAVCPAGWIYGGGGAVSLVGPHAGAVIAGNEIVDNTLAGMAYTGHIGDPESVGGGLYLYVERPAAGVLDGNLIARNGPATSSTCIGGGIGSYEANFLLWNNVIIDNRAREGGALFAVAEAGGPICVNNTIVRNTGSERGGALAAYYCEVTLVNCILWDNGAPNGKEIYAENVDLSVLASRVEHGWSGSQDSDLDPGFEANTLYELSDSSLCIGAGLDSLLVNGVWYYAPDHDFGGNPRPRPAGSQPDIGAREGPLGWPRQQSTVATLPSAVDFRNVQPGSEGDTARVVIYNRGDATLTVFSMEVNTPEFVLLQPAPLPAVIPPFQQLSLDILFRPGGAGVETKDTLVLACSDTLTPVHRVPLRGRGSGSVRGAQWHALYAISHDGRLFHINRVTGEASEIGPFSPDPPDRVDAFTVCREDSMLYGTRSDSSETRLHRLSSEFGDIEPAGTVRLGDVRAMACGAGGVLYIVDAAGNLHRSAIHGGTAEFVGATGHLFTGLDFSPATGVLWGVAADSVFAVDPLTGAARLVGTTGWYVPHPSLTFNHTGGVYVLYGNRLMSMDRVTGQVKEIGLTGEVPLLAIAMRDDIQVGVTENHPSLPVAWALYRNFPNPFNPVTTIRYDMPEAAHVTLKVFNVLGQEVATLVEERQEAGRRSVQFEGTGLSSGVYVYRLTASGKAHTGKMMLIR